MKFRRKEFEVDILNLDPIFHQNLNFDSFSSIVSIETTLDRPFYTLSFFQKIKVINILERKLLKQKWRYDIVIMGNDGAIQRLVLSILRRRNDHFKSFVILDGIISDYSFSLSELLKKSQNKRSDFLQYLKLKLKDFLSQTLKNFDRNFWFPSLIAQTKTSGYFVIGDHSKEVIAKRNKSEIYSYGLPRYESFVTGEGSYNYTYQDSVVYLTSAFKWHGKHADHILQLQDIEQIKKCIARVKSYTGKTLKLIIKVHPRESKLDYERFIDNWTVVAEDLELTAIYKSEAFVISTISTCILEATLYNKKIYSLFLNFPFWKYQKSFIKEKEIAKIFSAEELERLLIFFVRSEHSEIEKKNSNRLITKNKFSTDFIFNKIC